MRGLEIADRLTPSRILMVMLASVGLSPCRTPNPAELVVGVQSTPMGGAVSALHVVVKVGGHVATDETLRPARGAKVGFPQPWERRVVGPPSGNAPVDVEVDALGEGDATLLTRLASTRFYPGKEALLRVQLENRCLVFPQTEHKPGAGPGPLSGPTCAPPLTCIQGTCQPSGVPVSQLETYGANWPTNAPDRCKGRDPGPPQLQVGTGQTDYLPLTPGQTLQAEAGPQGGHHVWIATRMKNLKQSLTTTRIEGLEPETGVAIPPSTFVFNYAPSEGGFCKLHGLRYQLDNGGIDYKQFLGKPLDVTVTLTDTSGTTVKATTRIQVAPTLVNP